jgi:RNA polymerase sigma-70 factor (ECF subfamily)
MNAPAEARTDRVARLCAEPRWQRMSAALCRRAGLQAADVDDLLQEVLLAVCCNPERVEDVLDRGKVFAWLRGVTRKKIHNLWRERCRRPLLDGPAAQCLLAALPARGEEEEPFTEGDGRVFRRALDLLDTDFSANAREAFRLLVLERHTAKEVAAALGVSVNAVHGTRHRVLKRLRNELTADSRKESPGPGAPGRQESCPPPRCLPPATAKPHDATPHAEPCLPA